MQLLNRIASAWLPGVACCNTMQEPITARVANIVKLLSLGLAITLVLQLVGVAQEPSERFFSDQSGKYRIKATITHLDETHVKLRKSDGTEVTVEIAKLSERDQKYLHDAYQKRKAMVGDYPIGTKVEIFSTGGWHPGEILDAEPGKYFIKFDRWSESWNKWVTAKELRLPTPSAEPPDAMKSAPKSDSSDVSPIAATGSSASTAKTAAQLPDLNTVLAAAPVIDLRTAPATNVRFEPDPIPNFGRSLPTPEPIAVAAERIGVPMQVTFDSTMQYIAVDPVNFASAKHTVTVVPLDRSRPQWTILTGASFAGITDNAQAALFHDKFGTSAYLRVPLNDNLTTIEVSASDAWLPGSDHISRQRLLPGNRFLVATNREVQLWDLDSQTVTARFSSGRGCELSGQGHYLACLVDQDTVVVLDLKTVEVTHRFRTDGWKPINLSFDPAGSRLAITGVGRGQIHDLSTGDVLHTYGLTNGNSGEMGINWIGQRYLVLSGGSIVDLEGGLPIWSFPFDRQPLLQFDETTIGVASGNGTTATIDWVRITPEQLGKAASADTSNAISIPRGAIATLDVSGLKHHTQEVKEYFESSLQSLGYQLGPNGMLQIRFSSTIGSPVKLRLKDFMKVSSDAEATFIPATVTRQVLLNGTPIYDRTDEYGEKQLKSTITIQPDESAQDAVTRLTSPSKSLFTTVAIPQAGGKYLPHRKGLIGEGTLKDLAAKLPK